MNLDNIPMCFHSYPFIPRYACSEHGDWGLVERLEAKSDQIWEDTLSTNDQQ